jgi:hypothetical protein
MLIISSKSFHNGYISQKERERERERDWKLKISPVSYKRINFDLVIFF